MSTEEKRTTSSLGEWWKALEARDRAWAEDSARAVRFYKAMAQQREERENRERAAAWEARRAEERLETAQRALALAQERLAVVERMGGDAAAEREFLAGCRAEYERADRAAAAARAAAAGTASYP
jgi:hypothetical protein